MNPRHADTCRGLGMGGLASLGPGIVVHCDSATPSHGNGVDVEVREEPDRYTVTGNIKHAVREQLIVAAGVCPDRDRDPPQPVDGNALNRITCLGRHPARDSDLVVTADHLNQGAGSTLKHALSTPEHWQNKIPGPGWYPLSHSSTVVMWGVLVYLTQLTDQGKKTARERAA